MKSAIGLPVSDAVAAAPGEPTSAGPTNEPEDVVCAAAGLEPTRLEAAGATAPPPAVFTPNQANTFTPATGAAGLAAARTEAAGADEMASPDATVAGAVTSGARVEPPVPVSDDEEDDDDDVEEEEEGVEEEGVEEEGVEEGDDEGVPEVPLPGLCEPLELDPPVEPPVDELPARPRAVDAFCVECVDGPAEGPDPVDPPDPVVSANATAGIAPIAEPIPKATASAPTRPT